MLSQYVGEFAELLTVCWGTILYLSNSTLGLGRSCPNFLLKCLRYYPLITVVLAVIPIAEIKLQS